MHSSSNHTYSPTNADYFRDCWQQNGGRMTVNLKQRPQYTCTITACICTTRCQILYDPSSAVRVCFKSTRHKWVEDNVCLCIRGRPKCSLKPNSRYIRAGYTRKRSHTNVHKLIGTVEMCSLRPSCRYYRARYNGSWLYQAYTAYTKPPSQPHTFQLGFHYRTVLRIIFRSLGLDLLPPPKKNK